METKVHAPQDWLRELEIDLEPDRLKRKVSDMLDEIAPRAEMPGFRKGRVPRSILEQRLSASVEETAAKELAEDVVSETLKEHDWQLAAEPVMSEFQFRPDKSIYFKLRLEIVPEFEFKTYKGIPVERREPTGFEQEVERRFRQLQDRCATWEEVTVPAAEGLFVLVDWRTFEGDKEIAESRTNLMLELGDPLNFDEVNTGLTGALPGEERTIELTYPADHPDKHLAGHTVNFRFAVRAVKKRNVPPVDEAFALELGYDSLDELRRELNDSILADRARLIDTDMKNQILERLLADHEFAPPESWVQHSYERLRREHDLPEDDDTKQKLTGIATRRARLDIIAERIARAENIEISQEEVESQLEALARRMKRSVEDIAAVLDKPALRAQLLRDKVLDFLLKEAHVRGTLLGSDGRPVSSGDGA